MYICYVDESGDSGTFRASDPLLNPFFIILGLFIHQSYVRPLTKDFLDIKNVFFPKHFPNTTTRLDRILVEIKGNDLRKHLREENRRNWQNTIGFLDATLTLLEQYHVQLLGRILVKDPDRVNNDVGVYGRSMMHIYEHFNAFLSPLNETGIIIADSRRKAQNTKVCHTIFTQMHQTRGNKYPNIAEIPVYAPSNNFAMIQLADILCSATLFPMVSDVYNEHLQANVHISTQYSIVRERYKERIKNLQYMYQNDDAKWVGGLLVSDATSLQRKTSLLFR